MILFEMSQDLVQHADRLRHLDLDQSHQLRHAAFVLEHFVPHRLLPMPHAVLLFLAISQPGLRLLQRRPLFVQLGRSSAIGNIKHRCSACCASCTWSPARRICVLPIRGPIVLQPFLHPPHLRRKLRERIAHLLGERISAIRTASIASQE